MRHHHREPRHSRGAQQREAYRLRQPSLALPRHSRYAEGKARRAFPESIRRKAENNKDGRIRDENENQKIEGLETKTTKIETKR